MERNKVKTYFTQTVCALSALIVGQSAYAVITLEQTASIKGLLNTADLAQKCEERVSLASGYALSHYDVRVIHQDQAEISAHPERYTPAQKLISLIYHKIGEEPPKLTQKDPVRELSADDVLILLAQSQRPGALHDKQKSLCNNVVATLGSLGTEAGNASNGGKGDAAVPNLHQLLAILPEAKEFIHSCRTLLAPAPSSAPSAAPSSSAVCERVGGASTVSPAVEEIAEEVGSVAAHCAVGGGDASRPAPYSTAYDGKRFDFLKAKNISELFSQAGKRGDITVATTVTSQKKAREQYEYYRGKLENNFKFLNLVFKSLDQPLTQRALGAVYLKAAQRKPELKDDGVAKWISLIGDSCLSDAGRKFKSAFLKQVSGVALTADEEASVTSFQNAAYAAPADQAALEGMADLGEKLYFTEKFAIEKAPAPRRIIYRSFDQSKPRRSIDNFADCAETGIYDLVQTVFSKPGNKEFDLDLLSAKSPTIHAEISKHGAIPDQEEYNAKMRSGWNALISAEASKLDRVVANGATEEGKKFEVQANVSNFFPLMKSLFPGCDTLEDIDAIHEGGVPKSINKGQMRERKAKLARNFEKLSTCLSTPDKAIEITADHEMTWESYLKSENVNLLVKVKGKEAMRMELGEFMTPGEGGMWQRGGHFGMRDNIPVHQFWAFERK